MACENCNKSPLTSPTTVGTMKGGSEAARPSDHSKFRRPKGATANSLADFILRLHTFARDWSEVALDADDRATSALLNELAVLLKEEYDLRHGK